MSMVEVDFSDFVSVWEEMHGRVVNTRAVAAQVAEMLVSAVDELVENEGAGTWPAPAPTTIARALRKGYRKGAGFGKLLQDTGRMVGGVQASSDDDSASIASNAAYSPFHVEGTTHMPARDFLDVIDETFLEDVADLLLREVVP